MAHDGIGSRRPQGCRGIRTLGFLHTKEVLSSELSHTAMFLPDIVLDSSRRTANATARIRTGDSPSRRVRDSNPLQYQAMHTAAVELSGRTLSSGATRDRGYRVAKRTRTIRTAITRTHTSDLPTTPPRLRTVVYRTAPQVSASGFEPLLSSASGRRLGRARPRTLRPQRTYPDSNRGPLASQASVRSGLNYTSSHRSHRNDGIAPYSHTGRSRFELPNSSSRERYLRLFFVPRMQKCRHEDSNLGRPVPAVLSRFPLTTWVWRHSLMPFSGASRMRSTRFEHPSNGWQPPMMDYATLLARASSDASTAPVSRRTLPKRCTRGDSNPRPSPCHGDALPS